MNKADPCTFWKYLAPRTCLETYVCLSLTLCLWVSLEYNQESDSMCTWRWARSENQVDSCPVQAWHCLCATSYPTQAGPLHWNRTPAHICHRHDMNMIEAGRVEYPLKNLFYYVASSLIFFFSLANICSFLLRASFMGIIYSLMGLCMVICYP